MFNPIYIQLVRYKWRGLFAKAFLTTEENINKRLIRARQEIREDKIPFEVPQGKRFREKITNFLETLYLLLNEGCSASSGKDLIPFEIC